MDQEPPLDLHVASGLLQVTLFLFMLSLLFYTPLPLCPLFPFPTQVVVGAAAAAAEVGGWVGAGGPCQSGA